MDLEKIVAELRNEMERIGRAIGLLESQAPAKRRGRPPKSATSAMAAPKKTGRRGLTPAGRKRLSEMMKKRWAERRKQKA